jgi:hypothetical protein
MSGPVRVVLDAAAFARLVDGGTVTGRGFTADSVVEVEIMLSDIGFARMREAIDWAEKAPEKRLEC